MTEQAESQMKICIYEEEIRMLEQKWRRHSG